MKTIFKTKQKSSFRNEYVKIVAVAIIFGICIFTVNAQNFIHSISGYVAETNQTIALLNGNSDLYYESSFQPKANNLNSFAGYLETETEEMMRLEDWMTNENNFYVSVNIATETEDAMELENWMTNEKLFDIATFSLITEADEKLEMENWMTDENRFNVKPSIKKRFYIKTETFIFQDTEDKGLDLEPWMVNNNLFVR